MLIWKDWSNGVRFYNQNPYKMSQILLGILLATFLFSCNQARIQQLEKENADLRSNLDSIKHRLEENQRIALEMMDKSIRIGDHIRDSLIIAENLKVIKAYIDCDDIEANQDLERSVDQLKESLLIFGIEVYKYQGPSGGYYDCGYELAEGTRRKKIEGVRTDYDLALLIEEFYEISLLKKD